MSEFVASRKVLWGRGGREYPDRESLLAAETNGWIVIAVFDDGRGSVAVYGPWAARKQAENARYRIKKHHKSEFDDPASYRVRPIWKDAP